MTTHSSVEKSPVALAIERSKKTGEEFCVACGKDMGFLVETHIAHPIRYQGGARYVDCVGQVCGVCASDEK